MKDIEGKTATGFEYKIEIKRLDDMELMEVFAELDTNPVALPRALEMLFGKTGKKLFTITCARRAAKSPSAPSKKSCRKF